MRGLNSWVQCREYVGKTKYSGVTGNARALPRAGRLSALAQPVAHNVAHWHGRWNTTQNLSCDKAHVPSVSLESPCLRSSKMFELSYRKRSMN